MITLSEIRETPEYRKLLRLFLIAAAIWLAFFVLLVQIRNMDRHVALDLASGDRVLNYAAIFRAYPRTNQPAAAAANAEDPLTVISQIVDTLGLRSRLLQLQSNASGVSIQLERMYGGEMQDFLTTIESRGLQVRNAEIRVLPSAGERLLGATILLERNG